MENKLKKREEISSGDKWDLTKMIANEEEFNSLSKKAEQLLSNICTLKGHILDDAKHFDNYLKLREEYDRLITKLYIYANMFCDTDTLNSKKQALKMKAEKLYEQGNEALSFVTPELFQADYSDICKLLEEAKLEYYKFDFEKLFREKEHILSEKEESIISQASTSFGTGEEVFYNLDNADAKFGSILDENGKEIEITTSNYGRLMQNANRRVRKDCFHVFYEYFKNHKNTFAATLKGNMKENFFFSRVRRYQNPLEMHLYHDNISRSVYDNLIHLVHQHLPSMYEYMHVRKKLLNLEELHMYDLYCDIIVDDEKKDISFDEGKKIVMHSLKPLGEKYLTDLNLAFQERWIDKYPNVGKKTGGYKWGCFDSLPYILLNYDNTIDSVSTLAHELGHAMHSYYSNKKQGYLYHDYSIFLAEIASTVNEVLLDDYLYRNARTKNEKIKYLSHFLDKVRTTIYRQTMFAEFELLMHEKEEKGIPLTEEEFSNTYYELNKLYYGKDVVSDEEIRYEWSRIPHFYTSFYVYQYATGLISALALTSNILSDQPLAKEKYLNFLSAGCSNWPLEILKEAGVDMTTDEPYKKAFQMFDEKLSELKQLIEE